MMDYIKEQEDFRSFLRDNIHDASIAREIKDGALQGEDSKYSFFLQDIVNRIGELLGFEVQYGEYRKGQDGIWISPTKERALVVETKTSTTYKISLGDLLGYMSELGEQEVIKQNLSLGLYVIGKPDEDLSNLKNSIKGGGHQGQLRVITADGLLDLLELKEMRGLGHEGVLTFFPTDLVDAGELITRVRDLFSGDPKPEPEKDQKSKADIEVSLEKFRSIDTEKQRELMRYTKIEEAYFGEKPAPNWKQLVYRAAQAGVEAGRGKELAGELGSFESGETGKERWNYYPDIDYSIDGMNVQRVCNHLIGAARILKSKVWVKFYWKEDEHAKYPGKTGLIDWDFREE